MMRQILVSVVSIALGLSVIGFEVQAAESGVKPSGRARAYYESTSAKANSDADSVSHAQFKASSRIGITAWTKDGDWKGSGKIEVDFHDAGNRDELKNKPRDAWVAVENDSMKIKLGRHSSPSMCGVGYAFANSPDICIGFDARKEGVTYSFMGVDKLSVDVNLQLYEENAGDNTVITPQVVYDLGNMTIGVNIGLYGYTGNEDLVGEDDDGNMFAGDPDNTVSATLVGLMWTGSFGTIGPYFGFSSTGVSSDDGSGSVDSTHTTVDLGLNVDMDSMGFNIDILSNSSDFDGFVEGNTTISLVFVKSVAGVDWAAELVSFSSTSDDDAADGGEATLIALGGTYGF